MRTRLQTIALSLAALAALCGCARHTEDAPHASESSNAPAAHPEHTAQGPEGTVRIASASRRFLTVEPVRPTPDAVALRAPARVAFRDGAVSRVGAPLEGRVIAVRVHTGEHVDQDAPLVVMECPEAARARTSLTAAIATMNAAQVEVERETRLAAEGAGTLRDRLAAEVRLAEARAELARARATVRFVGSGDAATVVLRAPFAGTVISLPATVGEAAEPGELLVELGDPTALWVVGDVFERDLALVHEGATASVEVPSLQTPLRGHVLRIGAVVSTGLRTAPVHVLVDDRDAALRPGMFGRIRIATTEARLTLPTEAVLLHEGRTTVVYVARDEVTFERRAVTVGQAIEGRVQVLAGLSAGEPVVVRGALLLDAAADQLL